MLSPVFSFPDSELLSRALEASLKKGAVPGVAVAEMPVYA